LTRTVVDHDALIAYMRKPGAIAAEAAREFKISRVRVGQILKEKAPELLPDAKPAPRRVSAVERRAMISETVKALTTYKTKEEAAAKLGITVSGLNWRIRRLKIDDPLSQEAQTEALKRETIEALKRFPTKVEAARHLKIEVTSLTSRIQRYGLNDPDG
jgi:transcriptional regulator with GAF, ATPase, and Fis domain